MDLILVEQYPNIIKSFNISPETYIEYETDKDCFTVEYDIPRKVLWYLDL